MFKQKKKLFQIAAVGLASLAILAGCSSGKLLKMKQKMGLKYVL